MNSNETITFEPQNLTWSGRERNRDHDGNQPLTVRFDSPRWCDIAATNPEQKRAEYTTWFGGGLEQSRIKLGRYRLTIKAHGEWKKHPLNYDYLMDLSFQSENTLRIEGIVEKN